MTSEATTTQVQDAAHGAWGVIVSCTKLLPAGATATTSLLGPVPVERGPPGFRDVRARIPRAVQEAANVHGLDVVAADYRSNTYTLRKRNKP